METQLLTIKEVAERLHVSRTFVYTLLRGGHIPAMRFGRLVRVRQEDLERYIQERSFKNCKEYKNEG